MAKGVKPRIKVPKQATAGEAINIKTLISHKMETGLRKDADGKKKFQDKSLIDLLAISMVRMLSMCN
jgi:hypothetical protein